VVAIQCTSAMPSDLAGTDCGVPIMESALGELEG
jgi:hypothetical protein